MKTIILLYLLGIAEGGPSGLPTEAGRYNITQGAVIDVNERYDMHVTMDEIRRAKALQVSFALLYMRRHDAICCYERAIRVYTGGPAGWQGRKADVAWARCEAELERIELMGGRIP